MTKKPPNHLAMILDGNGRWARHRFLPRVAGHLQGINRIKQLIQNVLDTEIKYLTLFVFSTENWKRPKEEVAFLMEQFEKFLSQKSIDSANKNNIKLNWIGFQTNLSPEMCLKIKKVTEATVLNTGLTVTFAFNYGGQQDIEQAAQRTGNFSKNLLTRELPPIDLLIRTGKEKRLSNFLLYQIAYAEIIFEKKLWPAYTKNTLRKNLKEFSKRQRRYGGIDD